jgi:dehydratase
MAAGATLLAAGTAAAAPVDIHYSCTAATFFGEQATTYSSSVEATAPETVAAGETFTAVLTPQPNTVPTTVNGLPLTKIENISLTIPIPDNSTVTSATLSGGSGLSVDPVLTQTDTALVISYPSSIAGGAAYQLPALTLELVAGESGTITFKVGGTSTTDPGLTLTAWPSLFGNPLEATTKCFPDPNPVLASTSIA